MSLINSIVGIVLYKAIIGGKKIITWNEVQDWMLTTSSLENRPLTGSRDALHPFCEVRLSTNHDFCTINAEVSWSAQGGVIARKTWQGNEIDVELKKSFGRNRRFRIEL